MKKLSAILLALALLVPAITLADQPTSCPEGQLLVSVMTNPGSSAVPEQKHWVPSWDIFHIFGHWVIDVPYQPAVPPTYENQCSEDPNYVPPSPQVSAPSGGGICFACLWPNVVSDSVRTYDGQVLFLSQQFGEGGMLVGTQSHLFPLDNKGQPINSGSFPYGYDWIVYGKDYATYHRLALPDLAAGTYYVRPFFTPDQKLFPFYGRSFGQEIKIVVD